MSAVLCGGQLNVTRAAQNLSSPNYPLDYPVNTRCRWTLDAPLRDQVYIELIDLDIEEHDDCDYDFIEMRDYPMVSID